MPSAEESCRITDAPDPSPPDKRLEALPLTLSKYALFSIRLSSIGAPEAIKNETSTAKPENS
jgi:hypothetical protein